MNETIPRALVRRDRDRLRRHREYLEYYDGLRGALPPRPRERTLTFNYARAMVEKGASYLVNEHGPVVTAVEDTAAGRRRATTTERALLDLWHDNELTRLDLETEVDTAVLGDGAFKVTWDEREERVVVTSPDVQGLFAWSVTMCAGSPASRRTTTSQPTRWPLASATRLVPSAVAPHPPSRSSRCGPSMPSSCGCRTCASRHA